MPIVCNYNAHQGKLKSYKSPISCFILFYSVSREFFKQFIINSVYKNTVSLVLSVTLSRETVPGGKTMASIQYCPAFPVIEQKPTLRGQLIRPVVRANPFQHTSKL
jgi:hypothetical protein